MYLYALAAAGQPGVEKALSDLRREIERDMKLMGARKFRSSPGTCCVSDPQASDHPDGCNHHGPTAVGVLMRVRHMIWRSGPHCRLCCSDDTPDIALERAAGVA